MSFVSPTKQQLILDLLEERITEQAFCQSYPISSGQGSAEGLVMLQRALQEQDADAVEFGLYLGFFFGITDEYLATLNALAIEPWHKGHEDVVSALQDLKSPTSIEVLGIAARSRHDYMPLGESAFALAKKAIHALEKIATPEAAECLADLREGSPEIVRRLAQRILERVAAKAPSDEVRSVARRLLEQGK